MKIIKSVLTMLLFAGSVAMAQPGKPITIIVGFPPGTGNDLAARQVAKDITENGGPNIIVENKVGAGGNIAVNDVINSDTPKLLLHSNSLYLNSLVTKTMTIDLRTQLKPVAYIGSVPMVLETGAGSNIKTFEDIKKAEAGKLTYGSGGVGSLPHANMSYISHLLNQPMTHVPYQGASRSLIDLAAGRIDLCFDFYNSSQPFLLDQRLRALAVTGNKRLKDLPNVPTLREKGIDWPLEAFYMLYASPNFDQKLLVELRQTLDKAIKANSEPYERQSIQVDLKKLNDTEKVHQETIQRYQSLKFPIVLTNEKP
jgi:tripartite-type tricarboxylate transporter receptor subunit TctC